ncbi:sensor histidine kinase [Metabacillus schmidteae]|uniref:sensor histidine kinase n=1 Tax=Metabacillus schmidteae TaxID=2730405 RepID=UPI0015896696|nr:sensor histidine kinase [Metabacillus schmidteae]
MPILLWIILVYSGAILLQFISKPLIIQTIVFTFIIAVHISLYWKCDLLIGNYRWVYFFFQGILIIISSFLIPSGSPVILIGLLPILIAQSITIFQNNFKVFIVFIILYSSYCVTIGITYGIEELPIFIPILFIILTIVIFYSVTYNRQVNARVRMEYYLQELEEAHQKVEELTLLNERQRMARDLHDTLAQGVAGLIMQLEAIEAHARNGNTKRSQEIIKLSMQQARDTLKNARKAIDDLRTKELEDIDFYRACVEKLVIFSKTNPIKVEYEIEPIQNLSGLKKEHSLYILSECLTNVSKHSKAKKVKVTISKEQNFLFMEVEDDGVGFPAHQVGKYIGKYGLLGLKERARIINGSLDIISSHDTGTSISVRIPI